MEDKDSKPFLPVHLILGFRITPSWPTRRASSREDQVRMDNDVSGKGI